MSPRVGQPGRPAGRQRYIGLTCPVHGNLRNLRLNVVYEYPSTNISDEQQRGSRIRVVYGCGPSR